MNGCDSGQTLYTSIAIYSIENATRTRENRELEKLKQRKSKHGLWPLLLIIHDSGQTL